MNRKKITSSSVPEIIERYQVHPKKGMGQNFLFEEDCLARIAESANIQADESVLEIGPGLGSLTRHLARQAKTVIAVELDMNLVSILKNELSNHGNIKIIHGDILDMDPSDLFPDTEYLVVANIPYNITSLIIRHLLDAEKKPKRIILTVQKEVAERICECQGDMSLLALSVQIYGNPSCLFTIPAEAFHPVPQVDSAVVQINIYPQPLLPLSQMGIFFRLAKAGFSQKRKTLRNSLSPLLGRIEAETSLLAAGIDPSRRPETLSISEWLSLCDHVAK